MKTVIQITFCLLLVFSCNKKDSENKIENPTLIKIGYYPTFNQSAETILNFNEKYLIFYSPTSYNPPPPNPPENGREFSKEEKLEFENYLAERPKLNAFEAKLNTTEINEIKEIIRSFTSDDLNMNDIKPPNDGMFINIIIRYSNGKVDEINPMNAPKVNHRILYRKILDIIENKNSDKNDSIIIRKIKEYH
ncbi:hypothetical protein [Soonwooa sp.]|uniref:hypothetical protein n=1 Tax=Soonwooa sp. TaxID=1938592 RepID=UPI00262CA901|nr:hypothetical protein [Soonwooa sp.]